MLAPWKKSYDKPRQHTKKQRYHFADNGLYSQSYGFSSSHVWMWELDYKESWAFELWCWRRLLRVPWTARRSNQSILKEISQNIHWEDWYWSWNSNTLATWFEELTHWKTPWCWERLKAGGEGDDRGWDGWMASLTRWTWVWASSGSWWWTGRPGVLQSMGSQRVRHNWMTELNWKVSELVQRVLMYPFPASPKDDILHTHSLLSIIKTLFDFPIFHRHQLCVCVSIRFHQMYINRCVCTPP